ncbi:hypothetical protein KJ608_05220 [Patescibacteria group bacterium]|nr:hypothetical protein [Patescibacteria group bacterium]
MRVRPLAAVLMCVAAFLAGMVVGGTHGDIVQADVASLLGVPAIKAPRSGERISGVAYFHGTATVTGDGYYDMSYRSCTASEGASWTTFAGPYISQQGDILAYWDTGAVEPGCYDIMLNQHLDGGGVRITDLPAIIVIRPNAEVCVRSFHDPDGDGRYGEPQVERFVDAVFTLTTEAGDPVTVQESWYCFINLAPGPYRLEVEPLVGRVVTTLNTAEFELRGDASVTFWFGSAPDE